MSATASVKRSWFRPHFSTMAIASLIFAFFVLINLPGSAADNLWSHGWPFTYLTRSWGWFSSAAGDDLYYPGAWAISDHVRNVRAGWLAVNFAIAMGITLLVAAPLEWWRRRRGSFARYSLRTAGIAVAVCSLPLAWLHQRIRISNEVEAAIERLETSHAISIGYKTIIPDWMRECVDDRVGRVFDDLTILVVNGGASIDEELPYLELMPNLTSLSLAGTQVTDAGLAHVEHLKQLETLALYGTGITDKGLVHLKRLDKLTYLQLDDTQVVGWGLANLAALERLESVFLRNTPLEDAGLDRLRKLPNLVELDIYGTMITEAGAKKFRLESAHHLPVDPAADRDDDPPARDASE